jgi:hypothetical protein
VKLGENLCFAMGFEVRRKRLRVYNPYRIEFNRARYALVNVEAPSYESFSVEACVSGETLQIDKRLASGPYENAPLSPVVSGAVDAEGNYLLRVRDMTAECRWIVRLKAGKEERFTLVDFNKPETARLAWSGKAGSK